MCYVNGGVLGLGLGLNLRMEVAAQNVQTFCDEISISNVSIVNVAIGIRIRIKFRISGSVRKADGAKDLLSLRNAVPLVVQRLEDIGFLSFGKIMNIMIRFTPDDNNSWRNVTNIPFIIDITTGSSSLQKREK